MRLSVSYSQDRIYPLEVYGPLQSLLLQSLEAVVRSGLHAVVMEGKEEEIANVCACVCVCVCVCVGHH